MDKKFCPEPQPCLLLGISLTRVVTEAIGWTEIVEITHGVTGQRLLGGPILRGVPPGEKGPGNTEIIDYGHDPRVISVLMGYLRDHSRGVNQYHPSVYWDEGLNAYHCQVWVPAPGYDYGQVAIYGVGASTDDLVTAVARAVAMYYRWRQAFIAARAQENKP